MTRQRQYCCTTSRMWQCVAMRSKGQEAGACTRPARQRGARCKCTAEILSNRRIHRRPRKNSDTMHASPLPCLAGERLGVKSPRSREDRHDMQDALVTRADHRKHRGKGVARHEHRCHHSGVCTENGSGMPHKPLAKSTCHEGRSTEEAMSMEKGNIGRHREAAPDGTRAKTCRGGQKKACEGTDAKASFKASGSGQFCVRFPDAKKAPKV